METQKAYQPPMPPAARCAGQRGGGRRIALIIDGVSGMSLEAQWSAIQARAGAHGVMASLVRLRADGSVELSHLGGIVGAGDTVLVSARVYSALQPEGRLEILAAVGWPGCRLVLVTDGADDGGARGKNNDAI